MIGGVIIIKKLLVGILMVSLVSTLVFVFFKNEDDKIVIDSIEKSYIKQEKLSDKDMQAIKSKISKSKESSNKNFILGYINLNLSKNENKSKYYFKKVIENKNKKTSEFGLIYSYSFMCDYYMKKGKLDLAIDYAKQGFDTIPSKDYGRYRVVIWNMFRPLLSTEKGRNIALDRYNEIKKYNLFMDKKSKIYIYEKLADLNMLTSKYIYAIENNLQVIELAIDMNSDYRLSKSVTDLGILARQLGEYKIAKSIMNSYENLTFNNKKEEANAKIYKYINLAEIENVLGNYKSALNYLSKIDQYKKYINPDKVDDIDILKYTIKAQSYIEGNKLELARENIDKAKQLLDNDKVIFYIDKDIEYYNTLGNLNLKEENYEEAKKNYIKVMDLSIEKQNAEYLDISLNSLYRLYVKIGDVEGQQRCSESIIKMKNATNKSFAQSYYKNAVYKYKEGKANEENETIKFRNIILKILILILFVILFLFNIYPWIINLKNRKKIKKYLYEEKYFLNYQPIVDPKSKKIMGLEALIRLKLKDKIIMPSVIIHEIEKCKMMGEVSIWILKKIINDYAEISKMDDIADEFYLSMNISLKEIEDEIVFNKFIDILKKSDMKKCRICIEITENSSYKNQSQVRENILKLSECGCLIALDDFGVEYSNISMLERFKFDSIKLDKYFIDNINTSDLKKTVIDTADYLSRTKNKTIIVEGVEDEYQMEFIKNTLSKKIYIQGYFYSKPIGIEDLKEFKLVK